MLGPVRQLGSPMRLSAHARRGAAGAGPVLGADTRAVLREVGLHRRRDRRSGRVGRSEEAA